jgi:hypothetical protein
MDLGDLVYSVNMGAFCATSNTCVNGFPPAEVIHVYQLAEVWDETLVPCQRCFGRLNLGNFLILRPSVQRYRQKRA